MGKKKEAPDQIPVEEILEIVRRYAQRFYWCSEAEYVLENTLGLRFKNLGCRCAACRGDESVPAACRGDESVPDRFTLNDGQPETVTRQQVEHAIKILRGRHSTQAGAKLIAYTLCRKFKINPTYRKFRLSGSYTVTEEAMEQRGWRSSPDRIPAYLPVPRADQIQVEEIAA